MKKIAIVLIAILCMMMAIGFTACQTSGQLPTPQNVSTNEGNVLTWDAVKNASKYAVLLDKGTADETVKEVTGTSYTYMTNKKGTHTMAVKAIGEGKFTDSNYSETFTFNVRDSLSAPTLRLERNGDKVTYSWDAVEHAVKYLVKIGLNVNDATAFEVTETSHTIDVKAEESFSGIGEYKIIVMAVSGSEDFANSSWSGQVSFINSKVIAAPTKFECDGGNFKWESSDANAGRFRIEAVSEDGKDVIKYETGGKATSVSNLKIEKPGKYHVTVMAYSTGDRRVFKDSPKSNVVDITILDPVKEDTFRLSGSTLSWERVEGAKGYTIVATTERGTSFEIDVESGDTTSYDLATNIEFKKDGRVAKVFTFKIIAKGDTTNKESLSFKSKETLLGDGVYYRYLPVASDYDVEELKSVKSLVIPNLVKDTKDDTIEYYDVTNYAQLVWALKNSGDKEIRLSRNIDIPSSEFVSVVDSFNGHFNGNNYAITGITMTNRYNRDNISLFGNVGAGAIIENVVISGVAINKINDKGMKVGIVANVNKGTIRNIVVTGDVLLLNDNDLGAIAYQNDGTIEDVVVSANLQARNIAGIAVYNTSKIARATMIGSLIGVADSGELYAGALVANNIGDIEYGVANAKVKVNTIKTAKKGIVGGIVALNKGNIRYTYFTNSIIADCSNEGVISYAGGFVGVNEGTIEYSYIDSTGSITRQNTTPLAGGFAGKNSGLIANSYSSIRVPDSYNGNKAAFVADNTNGTIKAIAYHQGKTGEAPMTLAGKAGSIDELSKGYESRTMTKAVEVLGDEFVVYKNFNNTMPSLKNIIYVDSLVVNVVNRDFDLSKSGDIYKRYFVGGEEHTVTGEIRTQNRAGYQIIKYTHVLGEGAGAKTIVYNRLVQVK